MTRACDLGLRTTERDAQVDYPTSIGTSDPTTITLLGEDLAGSLMEVDELIRVVDLVLRCGASASIPSVAVTPRAPA